MSTNTFDRPLVIEREEDIKRFWNVMNNSEPKPLYIHREFDEDMRRCEELLEQKLLNAPSH